MAGILATKAALAQAASGLAERAATGNALTARDIDAGVAVMGGLAAFFASPLAAPPDAAGVSAAKPLADAYQSLNDHLTFLRHRGQIAIGGQNLPSMRGVPKSAGAPVRVIDLDDDLNGAWQGAVAGATRNAGGDAWRYDGAVAQALLRGLAAKQRDALMAWHLLHSARASLAENPDVSSRKNLAALAPYWLAKDRYFWAANLARTHPNAAARRDWRWREAATLFEVTDALAGVESGLGTTWRKRLEKDWDQFRRGIESAEPSAAALAQAAGLRVAPAAGAAAALPASFSPPAPAVEEKPDAPNLDLELAAGPPMITPRPVPIPALGARAQSAKNVQDAPPPLGLAVFAFLIGSAAIVFILRRSRRARAFAAEPALRAPAPTSGDGAFALAEFDPPGDERQKTHALSQILGDIDLTLRRQWSQKLARSADAPRYIVRALAGDEIMVALPLLALNPVLTVEDLQEIVSTGTDRHRLAVAMRPGLDPQVAQALLHHDSGVVLQALLQNVSSKMDFELLGRFTELAARHPDLGEHLLARPEMDLAMARQLYWRADAMLRTRMAARFGREVTQTDQKRKNGEHEKSGANSGIEPNLHDAIAPEFLVEVLQANDLSLFKTLFGQLCGLNTPLVEKILTAPGGESLAVACRGSGIDKLYFSRLYLLSRRVGPQAEEADRGPDPTVLARALKRFESMPPESAQEILREWRLGGEPSLRDYYS